jgi:hypothetical protein
MTAVHRRDRLPRGVTCPLAPTVPDERRESSRIITTGYRGTLIRADQ